MSADTPTSPAFEEIVNALPHPVFTATPEGSCDFVNARYIEYTSVPAASLLGMGWTDSIHADDRERMAEGYRRSLETAQGIENQCRIRGGDGTFRWFEVRVVPIRDARGSIVKWVGSCTDIDATKKVLERHDLEAKLRQAQKMESVGHLAAGVAHDFNNLLTILTACTEELTDRTPIDDPIREVLVEAKSAVDRAKALTRDLLAYSRRQPSEAKVIDLDAAVTDAERMLRRVLGEDIELRTTFAATHPVRIDPGHLTSVLVNLAVNARQAMPRGGTLGIRTSTLQLDAPDPAHDGLAPGRYTVLEVQDSGTGFSPEVGARIFEPFFTTKGKGTGLGLAVVHGIVEQAGGRIVATSAPALGTTFRTYLPAHAEVSPPSAKRNADPLRGTERVLLVEDDDAVRRSARRGLEARGFTVFAAANAEAALAILEQSGSQIDILVTDVVLPKMDGRSLASLSSERFSGLKVLFTSGYAHADMMRYGISPSQVAFIEKPYTPAELIHRMRQIFEAK